MERSQLLGDLGLPPKEAAEVREERGFSYSGHITSDPLLGSFPPKSQNNPLGGCDSPKSYATSVS